MSHCKILITKCSSGKKFILVKRFNLINAFHAAGECRRQGKKLTIFARKFEIVKSHDHMWSYHEKCIQISTNMPGIGSLIREIDIEISEI